MKGVRPRREFPPFHSVAMCVCCEACCDAPLNRDHCRVVGCMFCLSPGRYEVVSRAA